MMSAPGKSFAIAKPRTASAIFAPRRCCGASGARWRKNRRFSGFLDFCSVPPVMEQVEQSGTKMGLLLQTLCICNNCGYDS